MFANEAWYEDDSISAGKQPRFRVICPSKKYDGLAKTEWRVYCMLGDSMFAHMILSGDFDTVMGWMADMGQTFQSY